MVYTEALTLSFLVLPPKRTHCNFVSVVIGTLGLPITKSVNMELCSNQNRNVFVKYVRWYVAEVRLSTLYFLF